LLKTGANYVRDSFYKAKQDTDSVVLTQPDESAVNTGISF
jgi:hypothetical protein